jgi:hypothetical protein
VTETPTAQVSSGTPRSNNRLVVWLSIMAGLSYVSGAASLTTLLPTRWAAGVFVFVGGLNAATAAYVAGVKPVETPVQVVTMDMHKP